ncbi:CsiV family protein [Pleionea sp. CnH1-48]|uniref:CsiV family protein n=1 Tax=Pleionea sp. CnH1-48 TaxID=2954494 RepID=UPI002098675B|nr:CsiV family protein [Pleionea sp. CnH1-48]MCO7226008.1 peptidoglycan binding protein CsiV [Pleionea sp. CnH1-48]
MIKYLVNKHSSKLWLAALLGALSQTATAQEDELRWFEVEVILFKQKYANMNEELWSKTTPLSFPEAFKDFATAELFPAPEHTAAQAEQVTTPPAELVDPVPVAEEEKTPLQLLIEEHAFQLLSKDDKQLSAMFSALQKSSRYEPLTHLMWRQPMVSEGNAPWIRLVGGKDFSESFSPDGRSTTETQQYHNLGLTSDNLNKLINRDNTTAVDNTNSFGVDPGFQDPANEQQEATLPPQYVAVPEIDGSIQVYLNRYLHINTQLFLRIPGKKKVDVSSINASLSSSLLDMTQDGIIDNDLESGFNWSFDLSGNEEQQQEEQQAIELDHLIDYPMLQSRRIRSKEYHYFDHPLFGMIIEVRPWEMEPPAEEAPTETSDDPSNAQLSSNNTGE